MVSTNAAAFSGAVDVNNALALDPTEGDGAIRTGPQLAKLGEEGVSASLTSATQSIPSSTQTVIAYDTVKTGNTGALDASNGEFVALTEGVYRLDWQARVLNQTERINIYVESDNGHHSQVVTYPNPGNESYPAAGAAQRLDAGQRMWAQIYTPESGGVNINNSEAQTYAEFWRV